MLTDGMALASMPPPEFALLPLIVEETIFTEAGALLINPLSRSSPPPTPL